MGIHDKKSIAHAAALQERQQRADRDYVARVQQRAARLTEAVDNKKLNPIGAKIAERRRQDTEYQMARLRSEAVQARRLAEHIESLSRRTTQRTRNRTMTESSIFDPGHAQQAKPTTTKKSATARGALTFNPLHPSMELPPEQLIRLLGMESKKTRKHMKTLRSSHKQTPQRAVTKEKIQPSSPEQAKSRSARDAQRPQRSQDLRKLQRPADEAKTHRSPDRAREEKPADRQEQAAPQLEIQPHHPMEYERNQPVIVERRIIPGWLLPALVIGLVAGAVVSGSLFWFQSAPVVKQSPPVAVMSSEPRKRQIPKQQPNSQQVKRKATPGSGETAKAATRTPAAAKTAAANDAKWQAAITAEQKRLRAAAEQRLSEQLTKLKVSRELADLPAPPANDQASTAATALPAAAEAVVDRAAVSEPAAAETVSPSTRDAAVEIPAETLPAVAPVEGLESDTDGELYEESTDLVDSLEPATVSKALPAVEQDGVSNTTPAVGVDTTTALNRSNESDTVSDDNPAGGQDMEAEQSSSLVSDDGASSSSDEPASF